MSEKSLWYKNSVFYEVYVRAFRDSNGDGHGDIPGLISRLDYLKELGVDCIWLLPIYPSPLKDDGYDIADYYGIIPEYGTIEDFKKLVEETHKRGMRIIIDLVLNHTSDQNLWFQTARRDRDSQYRDYYVWSDTDQKYKEARIIFLDSEVSNWTWDDGAGQFYWHRFYSSQPDLNYDNKAVQKEMLNVMKFWLDLRVDGFRVDAVPYLFEREGTNCENLPETHAYLKRIRKFVDKEYPDCILLCEANQWPEDVRAYFGDKDEFHMGFHFPVMPRIFMALKKNDRSPILDILERTPAIPRENQWCTFLRNHDELTLEMVTEAERQWMWHEYAPEKRMRLNLGIRRRLAPLLDGDQRKILLAFSLLFSLPGSPVIYYGDEIGMADNIWLPDRNGVRTPMQWENNQNAGFSTAETEELYSPVISQAGYDAESVNVTDQREDPDSLLNQIRKMIHIRKKYDSFGWGELSWLDIKTDKVAAYRRWYGKQNLIFFNNLSGDDQEVNVPFEHTQGQKWVDLLSGEVITSNSSEGFSFLLNPYAYRWFSI
jgi:maltose alpha-D-glucosyltransferase/alpha-amylase